MDLTMIILQKDLKKQFTGLGENTEKYITFTVLRKKAVTRIDKNKESFTKSISYILQFIISLSNASSVSNLSLSNQVNKISRIYRIKCKFGQNDKKCETNRLKYKYRDYFLQYTNFEDNLIEYKCLC